MATLAVLLAGSDKTKDEAIVWRKRTRTAAREAAADTESVIDVGALFEDRPLFGVTIANEEKNAMFEKGKHVYMQGDYLSALPLLQRSAASHHAGAQFLLAECFHLGRAVLRSKSMAVFWYRASARNGSVSGMYALARCLQVGDGAPVDQHAAFTWYLRAAQAGHESAMVCLANCYLKGEGTPKDINGSVEWFRRAAYEGDVQAMSSLSHLYEEGEDSFPPNPAEAAAWRRMYHQHQTTRHLDVRM